MPIPAGWTFSYAFCFFCGGRNSAITVFSSSVVTNFTPGFSIEDAGEVGN